MILSIRQQTLQTKPGPEWIEPVDALSTDAANKTELSAIVGIHSSIGSESGDFYIGAQYALAAMLQSPHFCIARSMVTAM